MQNRVVDMKIKMRSLRIPHPRLTDAQRRLHELRQVGKVTRGAPQRIGTILGPSGSGKSMIIRDLLEQVQVRERPELGRHPILHVTLSAKATVKQLGFDIIEALHDNGLPEEVLKDLAGRRARSSLHDQAKPEHSEPRIMAVATRILELAEVQLLVIDEVHHLVHSDGAKRTAWSVSEALKKLAIKGVCPLVLVGTGEARRIISKTVNAQIVQRLDVPILLPPLDLRDATDRGIFEGYVRALQTRLDALGIFPEKSKFDAEDDLGRLYDVSVGVIGTVSDLIEVAAEIAIRREARRIEAQDLSDAVDSWAIPLGHIDRNPWRNEPRSLKVIVEVQRKMWKDGSL